MSCCPVTAEPGRAPAPSTGVIKKVGQTTLYVTGPANAKAGVIAYPDIFGFDSGRSKADADTLGRLGYAVVIVDLVDGDYLDVDSDYQPGLFDWFKKYNLETQFAPRIKDAVQYLKTEAGVQTVASYGYCWGSWVGATQTATAEPLVTGHISFHPTWFVENLINGDGAIEKLAENVKVPQLLMAAGDDPAFVKPQGSVHKILAARRDIGAQSNVLEFPTENHGWVHRGDLENPATKKAVMEAWHAAVKFIQTVNPLTEPNDSKLIRQSSRSPRGSQREMLRATVFRSLAARAAARAPVAPVRRLSSLQHVLRASSSSNNSSDFSGLGVGAALVAVAAAGVALGANNSARAEEKQADRDTVLVNWSASHECRPQQFYVPETVEEIERLLKEYQDKKQKLRCMGAGVSPNGLGFSGKVSNASEKNGSGNEALMTMALFDKVLSVDKEKLQVTVEAGHIVGELLDKLRTHGMTMQNVASIRDQQVGGICQAGCHGTGAGIPPIDDQIVEMEIVTPAKGTMVLSATQNPDLFALAKCGLGALGVVTKVTLQCVPMHRLAEKTFVMKIDEIRPHHAKWLKEFQHLRYMWIPYTDAVVVVQCRRMDDSEPANDTLYPPVQHSDDERLEAPRKLYLELKNGNPEPDYLDWSFTKLRDKLLEINPLDKQHVIRVNEAEKQFWKLSEGYRVALSDDIIGFDCGGQQHVEEVSFPTHGTLDLDFMEQLLKRIDAEDIPAHAPIEQRWTASSTSSMSPASSSNPEQVFSWVGVILYLPTAEESARRAITQRFHEFYAMYRDFMEPFGATEHWAKIEWPRDPVERQKMRDRLKRRYPLDKFKQARDEVDPHHILSNHIVDELCA